jgi:pilus assembly protein CpaF
VSLLRRIERAQQTGETLNPDATGLVPSKTATQPARRASRTDVMTEIRALLQTEVIGAYDTLSKTDGADIYANVEGMVDRLAASHQLPLARDERRRLVDEVIADVSGLGPIEPLLRDDTITEVMVNGPHQVYIERGGRLELTDVVFLNDEHVLRIIDRIIAPIGRRIDETSPRVDARLADGSRVNAIIEPLSLVGPVITVRKFSAKPFTVADLINFGTATAEMFDFLRACVEARLNIFVSGGTGSGKTTTLNVLSSFIPEDQRIITIEDAAELQLRQEHLVTLEARPSNLEGEGEITVRDLLRNALHMRPDRIIVGECRGGEALDMIQAMTVGQDGSLSTGHANSPPDMLRRLETMVMMAGYRLPLRSIREQISSAVDLIVHTARLRGGNRKIVAITEVYGIEEDAILTQDIFVFEQTGYTDGKVEGTLKPTGVRPTFMDRFKEAGVALPPGEFGIPPEDPAGPGRTSRSKRDRSRVSGPDPLDPSRPGVGLGRTTRAGGMVYISSMGPVDPETGQIIGGGIKPQTSQCLRNIQARLEAEGSSLDRIVWAAWSLREPAEFDEFNEEWVRWFPGDAPVGQQTLMPPLQRRAGFRISIGIIAEASDGVDGRPPEIRPAIPAALAAKAISAGHSAKAVPASKAAPPVEPPGNPADQSTALAVMPARARPEKPRKPGG